MATPKVLLKRSAISGRVPQVGDLDYGEIAINYNDGKIYYKNSSNEIKAFVDSARVESIANAVEIIARSQLDSSEILVLVDSNYVNARIDPDLFLDSAEAINLIDSAYVQARVTEAYINSLTIDANTLGGLNPNYYNNFNNLYNVPTILDSSEVITLINANNFDSGELTAFIDSAYIQARQSNDADTLEGQDGAYYRDWTNVTNKPLILDNVDVSNVITADVDKAFVDALNVDADTLDGYHAQYFLDKIDSNVASQLDSSEVVAIIDSTYIDNLVKDLYLDSAEAINLIDSDYVQARQDYAYGSLTGAPTNVSSFTNDAGYTTYDSDNTIGLVDSAYVRQRVKTDQDLLSTSDVTFSTVTADDFVGDLNGAVRFIARADVDMLKGQLVYVTGVQGNTSTIDLARANSSSTMPAMGFVSADVTASNNVEVVTFGNLQNINVANFGETGITFGPNDTVYVSASEAGHVTNVKPSGESNLIQNIGRIQRHTPTSNMAIKVGGAGRTNATPNLDNDQFFLGNDSNYAVATDFTTAVRGKLTGGTGIEYDTSTGTINVDSNSTITINRVVADSGEIALLNFDENVYTDVDVPNNLPAFQEGNLFYFQGPDALTYSNASINVKIGQDEVVRVYNNTGTTIAKGKAVYVTGASNDFPTIALAKADDFSTVYTTIGLTSHSIADGAFGFVTMRGLYGGLNTAAFNPGDIVHVSFDSAGELTNTQPQFPNYPFEVGTVLVADSASGGNVGGCIQVNPKAEVFEGIRVDGNSRFDADLTVAGNLNILGTETVTKVQNLQVTDNFIYIGAGDTVTTLFDGTGTNDGLIKDYYEGDSSKYYFVVIHDADSANGGDLIRLHSGDSAGAFDNGTSTRINFDSDGGEATLDLSEDRTLLPIRNNIKITFETAGGHDSGDYWYGLAAPINQDLGIVGNYNLPDAPYSHAGFFRDASDQKFKIFNKYDPEVEGNINTSDPSFTLGTMVANTFEGDLTGDVTGDLTGDVTGTVSNISNHSTTDLSEGTNLYYTDARVEAIIDSAYIQARSDSAYVTNIIDNASSVFVNNVDSAYVQARQDFAYSSLTGTPDTIDSQNVINLIDSAYVAARSSGGGTDSATVSAIIANDVDSDYIFAKTKIKSSSKYYIQSAEPAILNVGEYWYKSDSDILYKSVPATALTTTIPAGSVNGSPYAGKLINWVANNPSSVTRTDISGTDALGGTFTAGTSADAWFFFTPNLSPPNLNGGMYFDFSSDVDIRGIVIEQSDHNAGRLAEIKYRNGDYADNNNGNTLTWYNSGGSALGKSVTPNGNTFRDISHPTGELAYRIGFEQIGDYYSGNDVFLFFAGGREWEEIDRSRTDAEVTALSGGLDSGQVTGLIDSAYISARTEAGTDSATTITLITDTVDSAYVSARAAAAGTDSSTVVSIIDSHVNVSFINALGAVDAETLNGESAGHYLDWNNITSKPTIPVQNKTNIDALNIDADTLDGQHGAYYLNYSNLTGTPNVLDSNEVKGIFGEDGDNQLETNRIVGLEYLEFLHDSDVTTFLVEVGTKTVAHRYEGTGSTNGYVIRNQQAPMLQLVPGNKYRFDQSNGTNAGHPIAFYYDAAKTTQYTAGVTTNGVAGQAGSYTQIEVTDTTPQVLHYQCTAHGYMGNSVFVMSRNLTGFDTDDLSEGSTNLYYTNGRVTAHVDSAYVAQRQDYSWSNITGVPKLIDSALVTQLIDSAYIAQRESGTGSGVGGLDSDAIFAIIDSDYIQAREAVSAGGANVAFKTISVSGNDDIVAGTATDTLTFEAGTNITLSTDANTKTVTINSSGGGGGGAVADGLTISKFVYTADSGQITFTDSDDNNVPLAYNAGGVDINVYLNGVLLVDSADFTKTDSSTITLTDSAALGDNITIIKYTPPEAAAEGVDSAATITLIQQEVDSDYIQSRQGVLARGTLEVNKYFFEADQGDTVFSGADKFGKTFLVDPDNTEVYINGILQELTTDYTIVDSNVTFTEALDSGYSVSVIETVGRVIKKTTLAQTTFQFTADSGQTVFSGTDNESLTMDLSSGVIEVYLNGILLSPLNDFTREANTITLTDAADSSDLLSVVNTKGSLVSSLNIGVTKITGATGTTLNKTGFTYVAGSIQVFKNGDLLAETTDYTATDGTNINLTVAAISSDVFLIQQFSGAKDLKTVQYQFLADSGQTTFTGEDRRGDTLTYASNAVTVVYVNGIALQDSDDYTATNGYEVTLTTAAALNDDIKITYEYTADSGQTTFSGADDYSQTLDYSVGRLNVYLNGIFLQSADYTATNGTSIVLTEAADSGDILQAIKYTGNNIGVDSATVLSLINEDYIINNGGGGTVDSAGVTNLIDSAYIQARQSQASSWTTISTNIELDSNSKNIIDTTTNPIDLTLPPGPGLGTEVRIIDGGGNAGSNNITLNRNGENIMGADSNLVIDIDEAAIGLVYYNLVSVYDSIGELPVTSLVAGTEAYVKGTNRYYITNGTGWYNITMTLNNYSAEDLAGDDEWNMWATKTGTVGTDPWNTLNTPNYGYVAFATDRYTGPLAGPYDQDHTLWLVGAINNANSAGSWRSIEFERDSSVVATLDWGQTGTPSPGVANTEAGSSGSWSAVYNSRNTVVDIGNLDVSHTGAWAFIYDRVRFYSGTPGNTLVYTERVDTS